MRTIGPIFWCAIAILLALNVSGCTSGNNPSDLPGGARLVAESPAPLSFIAPEAGTLFVRDRAASRVAYTTRVEPGDRVNVDEKAGRLMIAGKTVDAAPPLSASGGYELFFKAATKREYHPAYNP